MNIDRRNLLDAFLVGTAWLATPGFASSGERRGEEPRARARDERAVLSAVLRGDRAAVADLLEEAPELVSTRDPRGRTLFVLAWIGGYPALATDLLALLKKREVPLDIVEAVLAQDWDRFEALCETDPGQLHVSHPIGGSPLYAAALVGEIDLWRLRAAGARPDGKPAGGSGFTAARGAVEAAHPAWARIALADLCSNGADINAVQRDGSSVLHGVVRRRSEELLRLAVRKGADATALDQEGRTPYDLASEIGWREGARLLQDVERLPRDHRASRFELDANHEPVQRPDLSDVPSHVQARVTSVSHGNLPALRELIAEDSRLVFSISPDDELAIEACAHTGARDVIRFHLDQGAPLSLPTAVSLGDLESVSFWLRRDPLLIHERGAHDFPIFWFVVFSGGSVEMADLLHRHGAPVDQGSVGTTTLHAAAARGQVDLVRWLLEHGADPDAVGYRATRDGQTALQAARARGHDKVVKLLQDHGARR